MHSRVLEHFLKFRIVSEAGQINAEEDFQIRSSSSHDGLFSHDMLRGKHRVAPFVAFSFGFGSIMQSEA